MNHYPRFAAMIATSTVVMFGLMYLNSYAPDHIFFSETRAYMALVMGATMAVLMLGFMLKMYENRKANIGIFAGSIIVFAGALWLVRSQKTVEDVSWMKAMMPHHSIAIVTSERAHFRFARARSGRPDHRGATKGDWRDESLNRRDQKQVTKQTHL